MTRQTIERIAIQTVAGVAFAALLVPAAALAHVSITPRASTHGATEKYTIWIPTEGKVATTGADIEFKHPQAGSMRSSIRTTASSP